MKVHPPSATRLSIKERCSAMNVVPGVSLRAKGPEGSRSIIGS